MPKKDLITAWVLPATITLIATGILLFGEEASLALRYDRTAIASGEYLRFVSGHFVHLGTAHFLLNIAGLLLVWYLVGSAFSTVGWGVIIASSVAAMNLGFWFLMPELDWYVGLSGLLHGLLAAGITAIWRSRRTEAVIIAVLVLAKLGHEALIGPLPGSEGTAGGDVVTEAHLFGALGGFAAGLVFSIRVRPEASI